jgi:hypothetical protein
MAGPEAQRGVQRLSHHTTELDRITYLILLQKMVLDDFPQMLFCEKDSHCASS